MPHVYGTPPSLFAKTLCRTIPIEPGKTRLFDIGCGCGIIGIFCLMEKKAAFVTFNDLQEEMVSTTRANVDWQIGRGKISDSQVDYVVNDFANISAQMVGRHTLVAFNPPQLPEDSLSTEKRDELERDPAMSHFRLGGPDGLNIVRGFLGWYSQLEGPMPGAVILLSSFLGMTRIASVIEGERLAWRVIQRTRVPLRAILSAAADRLSNAEREDRALRGDGRGNWSKELLTISVTKP